MCVRLCKPDVCHAQFHIVSPASCSTHGFGGAIFQTKSAGAWPWQWSHLDPFGFTLWNGIKLASGMPKRCQNTLMYRRHIDVSMTKGHVFIDPQQNPLSHLLSSSAPMKSTKKCCVIHEQKRRRVLAVCGCLRQKMSCDIVWQLFRGSIGNWEPVGLEISGNDSEAHEAQNAEHFSLVRFGSICVMCLVLVTFICFDFADWWCLFFFFCHLFKDVQSLWRGVLDFYNTDCTL